MLDDVIERALARGTVEPAHLPMVAGIVTLLDVLGDQIDGRAAAARASHVVVSDDGSDIELILQESESGTAASIKLTPDRAANRNPAARRRRRAGRGAALTAPSDQHSRRSLLWPSNR